MFENLALNENGFLFDARIGNTFTLNRSGTFLLRQLINGTAPEQLPAALTAAFEVQAEEAVRDVDQFLFRLGDLGLLVDEGEEL